MTIEPTELAGEFRDAMRRLATTVTIVSTHHQGMSYGMTATAVTSVSTKPPMLLTCINRTATLHAPLLAHGRFCVNLLRSTHAEVSQGFAGGPFGEARFKLGAWRADLHGLPYLDDAQANIFCEIEMAVPCATHSIVIGRVIDVRICGEVAPLIYRDGGYAAAAALPLGH